MKKTTLFIVSTLAILLSIVSCTKVSETNQNTLSKNQSNNVDPLNLRAVGNDGAGYTSELIDGIKNSKECSRFLAHNEGKIKLADIKRYEFNKGKKSISISILTMKKENEMESSLIVFLDEGHYFFARSTISFKKDDPWHIEITNLDGRLFSSMDIDKEKNISNLIASDEMRKELAVVKGSQSSVAEEAPTNCGSLPTTDCVVCLYLACHNYWLCNATWLYNATTTAVWLAGAIYGCS